MLVLVLLLLLVLVVVWLQGKIFKNYATSWLLIDLASCLPITYVTMLQDHLDDSPGGTEATTGGGSTKAIKILRMLRLAKLLRCVGPGLRFGTPAAVAAR